ncbi:SigE family RNA polymerase sigma factor [Dactylosporangium vinaceum]|uniref:SigE family RNA polymerase sigma factor n=1 Tax=Dactylosporangium vinaceum TaxID=53362 RepID=A0ABV5M338_9ACTN|nr:SigE family RNA polymerase sigma factor [Dactylosporangium vinaceum]UAB99783.1 SigE family RNA polymerase sigma factor [Dactylosporangium vinaceum]
MRTDKQQQYVEYVTGRMPMLRKLAYVLCGDGQRADDLVQQTITRLYTRWLRVSEVEHLDQYVRTMLVRAFVDEKRRPWSRTVLPGDLPERPDPGGGFHERVVDEVTVRSALQHVPSRQRAVLILRFLCDMTVEEVAAALECSAGTVRSQSSRGLATLRRVLGDSIIERKGG